VLHDLVRGYIDWLLANPTVPVQPLLASSDREYAMFEHFTRYPGVAAVTPWLTSVVKAPIIGPNGEA
jgi:hypothetical protein